MQNVLHLHTEFADQELAHKRFLLSVGVDDEPLLQGNSSVPSGEDFGNLALLGDGGQVYGQSFQQVCVKAACPMIRCVYQCAQFGLVMDQQI